MKTDVVLTLRDGSQVTMTRTMVEEAAQRLPTGDQTRVEVDVDGRKVDAVSLMALAASVSSDGFRPHAAYEALEALDFELNPKRRANDAIMTADRPLAVDDPLSSAGAEPSVDAPALTRALAQHLQRYRGEWVAIRNGVVVASSPTLRELRDKLADVPVTVVRVPSIGRVVPEDI